MAGRSWLLADNETNRCRTMRDDVTQQNGYFVSFSINNALIDTSQCVSRVTDGAAAVGDRNDRSLHPHQHQHQ